MRLCLLFQLSSSRNTEHWFAERTVQRLSDQKHSTVHVSCLHTVPPFFLGKHLTNKTSKHVTGDEEPACHNTILSTPGAAFVTTLLEE